MADTTPQNPQEAQAHADNLQSQIDTLHTQAQTSSGAEKEGIMARIEALKQEKDSVMATVNNLETEGKNLESGAEGLMGKL